MADNNEQSGGLFGGLKKFLFKDEETSGAAAASSGNTGNNNTQYNTPPPLPSSAATPPPLPAASFTAESKVAGNPDEQMRAKAYQLLESINQPGCDFLEVWNAAEENGGATAQNIKAAFNALKYADKTLTKEKVMSTGIYYANELQKALDADIAKKTAERQQLDTHKQQQRQSLSESIAATERQITELQQSLADKKKQLTELDAGYEPKIAELEQKMNTGRTTIIAMIQQMRQMLSIVEKEL